MSKTGVTPTHVGPMVHWGRWTFVPSSQQHLGVEIRESFSGEIKLELKPTGSGEGNEQGRGVPHTPHSSCCRLGQAELGDM